MTHLKYFYLWNAWTLRVALFLIYAFEVSFLSHTNLLLRVTGSSLFTNAWIEGATRNNTYLPNAVHGNAWYDNNYNSVFICCAYKQYMRRTLWVPDLSFARTLLGTSRANRDCKQVIRVSGQLLSIHGSLSMFTHSYYTQIGCTLVSSTIMVRSFYSKVLKVLNPLGKSLW